jgi:hypothetical protein
MRLDWLVLQVDVHNAFDLCVIVNHFLGVMIFVWLSKLIFPICLTILCMLIPIVFFSGFLKWRSHSHFGGVKYMAGGPIKMRVV